MKYKLGFLGLGKMGSSILQGIIAANLYEKKQIILFDINEFVCQEYKTAGYQTAKEELEVVENCDVVILAIKPQHFAPVVEKFVQSKNKPLYVSIAAGISIAYLQAKLGKLKIIRVMPNTPALIGQAATAISRSSEVDDNSFQEIERIFASIGIVREIPEELMDAIVPVNGSMPAYLYYFVQAFIDNAVKNKIDYKVARDLACQAIIGSANMILKTNKPIDELIEDVCSPKGATLAGLEVLKAGNFQKIITDASEACTKRAQELGKLKP